LIKDVYTEIERIRTKLKFLKILFKNHNF
jgi:hypothetical protein